MDISDIRKALAGLCIAGLMSGAGCDVCRSCAIRHVCGGCLASAYSFGFNPLKEKDPYCFIEQ